jgi:acyl-CoA synthetase (AMP-forming)/AMP-acid ligase II
MELLTDRAKGSRTLLEVLDCKARLHPDKTFASVPKGSDIDHGFRDVTFAEIHRSINATAHWLEDKFGKSTTFETLLYLGVHDLRFTLIFFAAQKCGYTVSILSEDDDEAHLYPTINNAHVPDERSRA